MTLRLASLALFALVVPACSSTPLAQLDAAASGDAAAAVDAASLDDAGIDAFVASDTGPLCSCRSGTYHATGAGVGFTVDYYFDLEECDGHPVCRVGHGVDALSATPCMMTGDGAFRVYLDGSGFTQLVFGTTSCIDDWMGSYATEGGGAQVTATRI